MKDTISLEFAHNQDAEALLRIHAAAVHTTAAPFYSAEIIHSWARFSFTSERIEKVRQRWIDPPSQRIIVAKHEGEAVGFGFIGLNGELLGLYVHPHFGRQGIGSKILAALEQVAIAAGLTYLTANGSLNAEAFYRQQGFEVMEYGTHRLAAGQEMACVKLRKELSAVSDLAT